MGAQSCGHNFSVARVWRHRRSSSLSVSSTVPLSDRWSSVIRRSGSIAALHTMTVNLDGTARLSWRLRVTWVISITLVLTAYMHSKYRLSRREATAESRPPPRWPISMKWTSLRTAPCIYDYIPRRMKISGNVIGANEPNRWIEQIAPNACCFCKLFSLLSFLSIALFWSLTVNVNHG